MTRIFIVAPQVLHRQIAIRPIHRFPVCPKDRTQCICPKQTAARRSSVLLHRTELLAIAEAERPARGVKHSRRHNAIEEIPHAEEARAARTVSKHPVRPARREGVSIRAGYSAA
jgi:hypothetical protein